jgi:hypothetical protein
MGIKYAYMALYLRKETDKSFMGGESFMGMKLFCTVSNI